MSRGDARGVGANRLARAGLVKRVIGTRWIGVPGLTAPVTGNQVEGMPLGVMSHL